MNEKSNEKSFLSELTIKGHFALKDQTWNNISKGLNIITSVNGGGKTSLLQHIFSTHHKEYVIRNISQNITQFQVLPSCGIYESYVSSYINAGNTWERYLQTGNNSYQNFLSDYKTLFELGESQVTSLNGLKDVDSNNPYITGIPVVDDCNAYFQELGLKIRITPWPLSGGKLRFYRENKSETLIEFVNISTGERTAFVLWLIMRSNPTPQIILLDEFDSGLDDDIIPNFMKNLAKIAEKGVQIFISTHKKNSLKLWHKQFQENNSDGTRKYTIWNINNDTGNITG